MTKSASSWRAVIEIDMRELLDLLVPYRPSLPSEVQGAPPEKLARLRSLVGELPGTYVDFLETMGESTGDFSILGLNSHIDEMIEYARERQPDDPPEQYVMIAVDEGVTFTDVYLDRGTPCGADDCALVWQSSGAVWGPTSTSPAAPSLRDLLYPQGWELYRLTDFHPLRMLESVGSASAYGAAAPVRKRIAEILLGFGFRRLPQTTLANALFERADAEANISTAAGTEYFTVAIGARDPSESERIANTLVDNLPLKHGLAGARL